MSGCWVSHTYRRRGSIKVFVAAILVPLGVVAALSLAVKKGETRADEKSRPCTVTIASSDEPRLSNMLTAKQK